MKKWIGAGTGAIGVMAILPAGAQAEDFVVTNLSDDFFGPPGSLREAIEEANDKKGKDGLCGGSGKDKLKGGPGKDKLNGGPGKDKEVQ